jgi:Kef-type K+ transport system membrane component KefB
VLIICAAGERIGLSGAKTAFFLGLFMSRIDHDDKPLEDYISPISRQFLIPLFFVSMGMQVDWRSAFSTTGLLALGAAGLLLGFRKFIHLRWLKAGQTKKLYLLLCPNLTVAAVAASLLMAEGIRGPGVTWLLLTALIMTTASLLALPVGKSSPALKDPPKTPDAGTPLEPRPQLGTVQ